MVRQLLCAELIIPLVTQLHKAPTALEAPVGKDGDATVADLIQDDSEETAEDAATLGLMTKDMENLLYTLSEREGDVLRLRYGLDDGREKTLEEVGRILLVCFLQIFCVRLGGLHGTIVHESFCLALQCCRKANCCPYVQLILYKSVANSASFSLKIRFIFHLSFCHPSFQAATLSVCSDIL